MVARASGHGNLIMVKFLIDKGFEYRHTAVTQAAAASGNLELLMHFWNDIFRSKVVALDANYFPIPKMCM